jgi:hypothetical protein
MDVLERDYSPILLADHAPPCLSLYQRTHRHHPDNQQDPIRFRNSIKLLEASLRQKYTTSDVEPLLAPFHALAADRAFWNHTLDGLAVLAAPGLFKVYRLQRPVRELAIVADSFHTKPLLRILQSADRYHILGLNRHQMRLFEANRDTVDEIEPQPGVPRTVADVVGEPEGGPERKNRVYGSTATGAAPAGTTSHGTDVRKAALDNDTEHFFRAVDREVLEHYSQPSGMPLLLAALPEHHHLFRSVSRNPLLLAEAIDTHPDDLSLDALRQRAWSLMLPRYLERLSGLTDRFHAAKPDGLSGSDLAAVAKAAAEGRIAVLLIEADRQIPGAFDAATGAITRGDLAHPELDDLLDDLGERVLKTGGEVVVVPAERMPTKTGLAAIYRY